MNLLFIKLITYIIWFIRSVCRLFGSVPLKDLNFSRFVIYLKLPQCDEFSEQQAIKYTTFFLLLCARCFFLLLYKRCFFSAFIYKVFFLIYIKGVFFCFGIQGVFYLFIYTRCFFLFLYTRCTFCFNIYKVFFF